MTVIGSKAYGLLRNLLSPAKPVEKEFDAIVQVMQNHLNPRPLIIAERFKFHRRSQGGNESVAQYVAELRKLSERCDFGEYLEQALRDCLVCGLVNEKVQQRLLSESDLSLKKAFEIAQGMEAAQKETYEMRSSTSEGDRQVNIISRRPCTRCGKQNHHPDRCFYKDQEMQSLRKKRSHSENVSREKPVCKTGQLRKKES